MPPPRFHETPSQAPASLDNAAKAAEPAAVSGAEDTAEDSALAGSDRGREELPVGYEVRLQGHHRLVTALDVDRAGVRVVTGGADYQSLLYDFNGMKSDCKPFRELMPHEGHPVHAVSFSPSGDAFIAVTGEQRAKVLTPLSFHFSFTAVLSMSADLE